MPAPRNLAVHIETTTVCQANCSFCPHSTMKRPKVHMSEDVYIKAIERCKEWGVREIFPFLQGEPLCDPSIYDRIHYTKAVYPEGRLGIYTNLGIPIKEDRFDELMKLDRIVISMADGIDEDVRRANYKLLYDRAPIDKIVIHTVTKVKNMDEQFELNVDNYFNSKRFYVYNWAGKVRSWFPNRDGHCYRPNNQVCIMVDGSYGLCCMDNEGVNRFGNVSDTSLEDMFYGPEYSAYRTKNKSELEFCKKCNMPTEEET